MLIHEGSQLHLKFVDPTLHSLDLLMQLLVVVFLGTQLAVNGFILSYGFLSHLVGGGSVLSLQLLRLLASLLSRNHFCLDCLI